MRANEVRTYKYIMVKNMNKSNFKLAGAISTRFLPTFGWLRKRRAEHEVRRDSPYKMRKCRHFAIAFVAILVILMISCIIAKDAKFSETENRLIAKFPEVAAKNIASGSFTEEFEKYAADTVVFRDFWVKLKNSSDKIMLKKDNGVAYFGNGTQLFPIEEIDSKRLKRNLEAFQKLKTSNDLIGINTSILLAPTANLTWNYKLSPYTPNRFKQATIFQTTGQEVGDRFIDIRKAMKTHEGEYIYYKTDHHWTSLGAYYAYTELARHLGFEPVTLEKLTKKELTDDFHGTTEAKISTFNSPSDEMWMYESENIKGATAVDEQGKHLKMFDESYLKKRDKYAYFMGGNPPYIEMSRSIDEREKIGNTKSILIIKDSYANCLAPLLLEHYQKVYMVDLRYYRKSIKSLIADIRYKDNVELSDVLVLYNAPQFSTDVNAALMAH